MKNDRIVYVWRGERIWERISFYELTVGDAYILCESDGTPVGHFIAVSEPYTNKDRVGEIENVEMRTS